MPNWRLVLSVFLPFTTGYYLTSVFRTINALISGQLVSDLALGAADLGLLTSVCCCLRRLAPRYLAQQETFCCLCSAAR
jgi:hypothetical protein